MNGTDLEPARDLDLHAGITRVRRSLADLGAFGQVTVLSDHARTAAEAARQLGVDVGAICSSLVFAVVGLVDDRGVAAAERVPLLVLTSGRHRVDTAQVAALLDADLLLRADPEFVRRHTGFAIGGVAPVGLPHPVTTLVDVALAGYDVVWAAAGHPRAVFPTRYDELLRITGGSPAEVN